MTKEQADKIIELLEKLNEKLDNMVCEDGSVAVVVQGGRVEVSTPADEPIQVWSR